jgi:hypothetical protein
MMFEFMTSDMRKPLPEIYDDLVRWNYTVVLMESDSMEFERYNKEIANGRKL